MPAFRSLRPLILGGWLLSCAIVVSPPGAVRAQPKPADKAEETLDFERARQLLRKKQSGEKLTPDDEAYLQKARAARGGNRPQDNAAGNQRPAGGRDKIGLKPLSEMSADDRYKGQDGGLYGGGRNVPPEAHRKAAEAELAKIEPLDRAGQPTPAGKIVLVSISMSNATQEFSKFKQIADLHAGKARHVTIIDCAQGGQAMAEWVDAQGRPWQEAERRIQAAGVSDAQVQVAWIKLANKGPRGELAEHGEKLQRDTQAVLQNAKARFPNLRIAYLGSRIYGGYATNALNPEPYAYESAFVVRWLIQDQANGEPALSYDPHRGEVKSPLLLWGPYFWADGVTPRVADKLVYTRDDLAGDGTHPSQAGREKVARQLLAFFSEDPLARGWFAAKPDR